MQHEGPTDYQRSPAENEMYDDTPLLRKPCSDQLVQNWTRMVDRCLEQQWKDSQQLLGCAKTLKDSGTLHNPGIVIKELSDLGLGMMQRSIDMRQELVNSAYTIDNLEQSMKDSNHHSQCPDHCDIDSMHSYVNSDMHGGDESSGIKSGDPSCYIYLPSSPESDVYEPLITKIHPQSTKHDKYKRLSDTSDVGSYYSPFTLHSKLWQHQRLHQKHSDSLSLSSSSPSSVTSSFLISASTSTLHTLNSPGRNSGKANLRTLLVRSPSGPATNHLSLQDDSVAMQQNYEYKTKFLPSSTYESSSSRTSIQATTTSDLDIQCNHCFSSGEVAESVNSGNSPRASSILSHKANTLEHEYERNNTDGTSASPPPVIPIPIRTSSSLDTAIATPFMIQLPKATVSTPLLQTKETSPHITPSVSSSSVVHTISSKFHFRRNMATPSKKKSMIPISASSSSTPTAFSHHRTSSPTDSNDNTNDGVKSNRFVRSFITRKVSFPSIFSSKKIHPNASVSGSIEQSNGLFI